MRVIAARGLRGLTHRAVDAEAGEPSGTTSNYFRRWDDLLAALAERIFERLSPGPAVLEQPRARPPTMASFLHYLRDIVRRTTESPGLTLALFELRIEAVRHAQLAEHMHAILKRQFEADVAFHSAAKLPGGRKEIALLHYAVDGLLLDRLGPSMASGESTDRAVQDLVSRLVIRPKRGSARPRRTTQKAQSRKKPTAARR